MYKHLNIILTVSLSLGTCLLFMCQTQAHPARPRFQHKILTLRDAVMLAMRRNPEIRSGEIQRVADRYALETAYYQFQPQFAINSITQYWRSQSTVPGNDINDINRQRNNVRFNSHATNFTVSPEVRYQAPFGTQFDLSLLDPLDEQQTNPYTFSPTLSLSLTQPLLRGFGRTVTQAPLTKAKMTEQLNKLNLKNTVINTITNVLSAYRTVVADRQNFAIQQAAVHNDKVNIKVYKDEINAGRKAPADLNDVQTRLFNDRLNLVNQRNQIAKDQQNLLLILGLDPRADITISRKIAWHRYTIPTEHHSIQLALKNNIAYQKSLISLAEDKLNLITSEDQQRWQLNLTLQANYSPGNVLANTSSGFNQFFNGANNYETAMLNLVIPIADKTLKMGVVNARVALEKTRINLKFARWKLETQVINNIRQLKTELTSIKLAKLRREYARKSYYATREKILAGRGTTFELTQKAAILTQAEQAVIKAEIAFLNDYAHFDALLGTTLKTWNLQVML